ncbi:MAG: polyprenyl synthetase family protein [Bacteroidales bacterium]|nr:polyprenyl synthetase family protein [Bacteroidales bacterium]
MLSYSDSYSLIERNIAQLSVNSRPVELYEPIQYILSLGGKRIRPCLALMAHNLFSEQISDAINPALGLEVFHNFTLLHDDIMDNASKRRNHDTVHVKWNENIAILSGDAMMILAYQLISKTQDNLLPRILSLFNKTALEVCEGQQFDMNFEKQNTVTVKEYLNMIRLKTAVLIASSLAIGTITGKAKKDAIEKMYLFGLNIGIGFQLQDDYLDVYAQPEKFGKNIGSDILSNKKTYLLINALSSRNSKLVKELKQWMDIKNSDPDAKIKGVKTIYDQLKIGEITENTVKKYFDKGLKYFQQVDIPETRKENLRSFVNKMIIRDY